MGINAHPTAMKEKTEDTMKVIYRERNFIDTYKCIDHTRERNFSYSWEVGGLTYFRRGQFETFSIANEDIISIVEQ